MSLTPQETKMGYGNDSGENGPFVPGSYLVLPDQEEESLHRAKGVF
jgi:hypothetical protein